MSFLHPGFLYALFALAVPIILHFFSLKKYKKVYFSNFTFLEALQQQRKNSSKLKNLLLLLLRLVVLTAIVFAFASPYFSPRQSGQVSGKQEQVILYADNSFSMSNTGSKGSLLDEAKKCLFDIVSTYPTGTSFTLLTNDNVGSRELTKEQTIDLLGGLRTTPMSRKLSEVMKEAREMAQGRPATLFLISDFQKSSCDFQQIGTDSLIKPVFLVLEPENRNNLFIKEVSFEQAFHKQNQNDKVLVTVVNASDKDFNNIPVSLTVNDRKKSMNKVNVPANSEASVEISYLNTEAGFYRGVAEITDFPVVFDNKFYFSYGTDERVSVLCIEQDKHCPFFGKLFADTVAFGFDYVNVNQTSNVHFNRYNLIILDRLSSSWTGLESSLESYVQEGGNLFVLPGEQQSVNVLNRLLQKLHAPQFASVDTGCVVARVESESVLFKDAFEKQEDNMVLPRAHWFYKLGDTEGSELFLESKQGDAVLAGKRLGKGCVFVSAFNYDSDNSDMAYHPLFVPMMVNMACNVSSALRTAHFLNSDVPVTISNKMVSEGSDLHVRGGNEQKMEFIPTVRKDFSGNLVITNANNVSEAGLYEVMSDEEVVDVLAFNYNRIESEMQFCSEGELQKYFPNARVENIKTTRLDSNGDLVREIVLQDNNTYLSGWFILLAAIALLLEQVIWRRKLT